MKCFIVHVFSDKNTEQEQYIPRTRDPRDVHLKRKTFCPLGVEVYHFSLCLLFYRKEENQPLSNP